MSYITSIDTDDLTNPSSARKYDLGVRFVDFSSSDAIKPEYIYVKASGALTQFQPYQVSVSNTVNGEVTTKAPETTSAGATIVAPQVAVGSGNYCFVQYKGISSLNSRSTSKRPSLISGKIFFIINFELFPAKSNSPNCPMLIRGK